ncbi:MAG: phosphotransferase [Halomonas sp.]|jgi:aminoglycoside/choline kinase family phosphotransferase|uniref:Aminoglycoside phosphotransferase n=1 Tax=Billgrantia tianxiuensis TaxID=2497861 RepID=A0A6I6SMY1_9GAMM|nr:MULTISPECIES: phosphotransferase [Halomonas]MCE8033506.1 phosphotransferase [Halomonas sp. MCCC 1A11057]MDX5432248.1 phosphotransferase [Halomonas sp.]QHC49210.1 aminoglycoside phosphotransferase [Halomonas tianxiuensis]
MTSVDTATRFEALRQWVANRHHLPAATLDLRLAAGDASFRRYFRLRLPDGSSRMLMDAPPTQEDSRPFVEIARRWRAGGLPLPALHAVDLEAGFLELDDLGDTPLQERFAGDAHADTLAWHERAMDLIHELQNRAAPDTLPAYDATLLGRELDLFPDWCLSQWLGETALPPGWTGLREALIESALAQPVVAVHRDYDAMNLMVYDERLFLIDFQDAVAGPISYDLISLLRGRYCRFSAERFAGWVEAFRQRAIADGRLASATDSATFHRQVQAMAAQRSLKVLGIFCRLTLRDGRRGYLERLPHFLAHLEASLVALPEHAAFSDWLTDTFRPALEQRLADRADPETT